MPQVTYGVAGLAARTATPTSHGFGLAIDETVETAVHAEALGLDAVWCGEHHASPDGYMPAPLVLLAAIAARTERIGVGTNVLLAPLWDPVRLYEEAAVLDQLAHGRLTLGLGIGYRPEELAMFGVEPRARLARLQAAVDALASAGRSVTAETLTPLPRQRPGPRVWLGGYVRPAVERAAAWSSGYLGPTLGVTGLARRIGWLDPPSLAPGFSIGVTVLGFVTDDERSPAATTAAVALGIGSDRQPSAPRPADAGEQLLAWGEPGRVAETLRPLVDLLDGLPEHVERHIAIQLTTPAVGHQDNLASVSLFAREVLPRLRPGTTARPSGLPTLETKRR
jgi:alkanesulfonate monooxygenase SsuD/methylene tetrahydromethanopterin reductase-like flavin-dependent oxidoreductase (luciferase family)